MQRSRASQIDISLDAISKVLPEDKQQDLQAVRDSWKDYQAQAGATAAMVQDGRQNQAEQSLQQSEKAYQKLSESMGQVTDYSKDFIHEETKEAQVVYDRAKAMMLVCIVLVVVLAGIMAYYLSGSILRSVPESHVHLPGDFRRGISRSRRSRSRRMSSAISRAPMA
jgi:methyl-accepting chemotaxis protein